MFRVFVNYPDPLFVGAYLQKQTALFEILCVPVLTNRFNVAYMSLKFWSCHNAIILEFYLWIPFLYTNVLNHYLRFLSLNVLR